MIDYIEFLGSFLLFKQNPTPTNPELQPKPFSRLSDDVEVCWAEAGLPTIKLGFRRLPF